MAKHEYKIDQVNAGDMVEYIDGYLNPEQFRWWKVLSKLDNTVIIEINKQDGLQRRAIDVKEILNLNFSFQ